jgi:hypothetical protein
MGKMNALSMIQDQIAELSDGFYMCSTEEQETRRVIYDQVQKELLEMYGENAQANLVDPWMFDIYSDLYKDRYNVRPRGHTYATMKAFMDNIPPLEDEEDDEENDDRFDPDIEQWEADLWEDEAVRDFEEVHGVSISHEAVMSGFMIGL